MNDPIVDEVRRIRDAHAAKFNYDPKAIFRDIQEQERRSGRKYVSFADVVREVGEFLIAQRAACLTAGIRRDQICLDPGIGFGKSESHNLALLARLPELVELGSPLLLGVSRKSFIGRILGAGIERRLYGGIGLAALAVSRGVKIIRTHDVAPTRDAMQVVSAVLQGP